MHQMQQNHKKLKKQQQQQQQHIPGAVNAQYGHHPINVTDNKSKSRKSNSQKRQNYGMQQPRKVINKLSEYYSGSSDGISDGSDDESSTIASSDSDDEQNGNLDSSTSQSSINSDILKEGVNIPQLNNFNVQQPQQQ